MTLLLSCDSLDKSYGVRRGNHLGDCLAVRLTDVDPFGYRRLLDHLPRHG